MAQATRDERVREKAERLTKILGNLLWIITSKFFNHLYIYYELDDKMVFNMNEYADIIGISTRDPRNALSITIRIEDQSTCYFIYKSYGLRGEELIQCNDVGGIRDLIIMLFRNSRPDDVENALRVAERVFDNLSKTYYAVARGVLESGVEVTPGLRSRLEELANRIESAYSDIFGRPIQLDGEHEELKQSTAKVIRAVDRLRADATSLPKIAKHYLFVRKNNDIYGILLDPPFLKIFPPLISDINEAYALIYNEGSDRVMLMSYSGDMLDNITIGFLKPINIDNISPILSKTAVLFSEIAETEGGDGEKVKLCNEAATLLSHLTNLMLLCDVIKSLPIKDPDSKTTLDIRRDETGDIFKIIKNESDIVVTTYIREGHYGEPSISEICIHVGSGGEREVLYCAKPYSDLSYSDIVVIINQTFRYVLSKMDVDRLREVRDDVRNALDGLLRFYYAFYSGILMSGAPLTPEYQAGTLEALGHITRLYEALFNKPIELTGEDARLAEKTSTALRLLWELRQQKIEIDDYIYVSHGQHIKELKDYVYVSHEPEKTRAGTYDLNKIIIYTSDIGISDIYVESSNLLAFMNKLIDFAERRIRGAGGA